MAGTVTTNTKKYYGGLVPEPTPQGGGDGKTKVLVLRDVTVTVDEHPVTKKLLCDPDSVITVEPFIEVVTAEKLAEWLDDNYVILLDDGTQQVQMLKASVSSEGETPVCNSVVFKGLKDSKRASIEYPCQLLTDESTLTNFVEAGAAVVQEFNLVSAYPEDTTSGTLIDKLEIEDTIQEPEDQTLLEVLPSDGKVAINEDRLRETINGIDNTLDGIIETIDEMDMDSVPHAYLHSTFAQSAGDSVATGTQINVFAQDALEGDCFEFEQTTTIDDTPFGYVWIEPGTYLINASVTLQWVGDPRGTFIAKVGFVMGENFDFSQEQEIKRNTTKIVTIPNRMKLAVNITYDAGTPVMGFWIQSMQVVKLAGGMSQTTVAHDTSLVGSGSVADPLGISTDGMRENFEYVKDEEYFATKQEIAPLATKSSLQAETARATQRENEIEELFTLPTQEAVNAWLDAHPEATTTVQDHSLTGNKFVIGTLNFVTPEMFGAVGDGLTDDTEAIQAAMDACSVVVFGNKTYIIDVSGGGWGTIGRGGLRCNSGQVLLLGNCTLRAKPNTNLSGFYDIISVDLAYNVKIIGGHIIGDLDYHDGADGEFGFGITICKANSVTVEGVEIEKCWGDGITAIVERIDLEGSNNYDDYCQNICIKDCHIHDCRRQGISVVNANGFVITGCYIHDIAGVAPQSCIDVEPDRSDAKNIVINDCLLIGSNGLLLGSTTDTYLLHNVSVRDCVTNISVATRLYETQVDSCVCDNVRVRVFSNTKFSNCVINTLNVRSSAKPVFDGCIINNGIRITLDQYVAGTSFVARNCLIRAQTHLDHLIYTNVYDFEKFEFHNCELDMLTNVDYFMNGGPVGSTVIIKGGTLRIGSSAYGTYVFCARPNNTTGGYSVSYIIDGLDIYVTKASGSNYLFLTDMPQTILNSIVKNCIIHGVNRLAYLYGTTGAVFAVANNVIKNSTYGLDKILELNGASGTTKYYSGNVNLDSPPTE